MTDRPSKEADRLAREIAALIDAVRALTALLRIVMADDAAPQAGAHSRRLIDGMSRAGLDARRDREMQYFRAIADAENAARKAGSA